MTTNYETYLSMFGVKMTNGEAAAIFETEAEAVAFSAVARKLQDTGALPPEPMATVGVEATPAAVTVRNSDDLFEKLTGGDLSDVPQDIIDDVAAIWS